MKLSSALALTAALTTSGCAKQQPPQPQSTPAPKVQKAVPAAAPKPKPEVYVDNSELGALWAFLREINDQKEAATEAQIAILEKINHGALEEAAMELCEKTGEIAKIRQIMHKLMAITVEAETAVDPELADEIRKCMKWVPRSVPAPPFCKDALTSPAAQPYLGLEVKRTEYQVAFANCLNRQR